MKKKFLKLGIAFIALGAIAAGSISMANINVHAAEATQEVAKEIKLEYDNTKECNGSKVIKGSYLSDDNKKFDMYYSEGFFKENPLTYQPHMATLAAELANASTTQTANNYADGAKHVREALETIGFGNFYVSDSYNKEPTANSIACIFGDKMIEDAKYNYAVDITVRSANYDSEWASNVKLGKSGEALGFKEAADQVVNKYLGDYLAKNPKIKEGLEKGKVAFFVNGYSRGAATANLTAKRLIDSYQESGNGVYAYCIEAPQGGVKSEIKAERDYRGIHNVVNPNDLVCYVAPTKMGFIRYGVDHFISGTKVGEGASDKSDYFNVPTDNKFDYKNYKANEAKVVEELKKMLNKTDIGDDAPYDVTLRRVDLRNMKLVDTAKDQLPQYMISSFINNLQLNNKNQVVLSREDYANKIEKTASTIMEMFYNGKLKKIANLRNITNLMPLKDVFISALGTLVANVKVACPGNVNIFEMAWKFVTGSKDLIYYLDFTESVRNTLAANLVYTAIQQPALMKALNENYPTKAKGAINDVTTVIREALKGRNNLDDVVSFGTNVKGIFQNHSTQQNIAWLRIEDTWFNK